MAASSLNHRLPIGPPLFVGRHAEQAWLAGAIRRASIAVLVGRAGIGKSALLLNHFS